MCLISLYQRLYRAQKGNCGKRNAFDFKQLKNTESSSKTFIIPSYVMIL